MDSVDDQLFSLTDEQFAALLSSYDPNCDPSSNVTDNETSLPCDFIETHEWEPGEISITKCDAIPGAPTPLDRPSSLTPSAPPAQNSVEESQQYPSDVLEGLGSDAFGRETGTSTMQYIPELSELIKFYEAEAGLAAADTSEGPLQLPHPTDSLHSVNTEVSPEIEDLSQLFGPPVPSPRPYDHPYKNYAGFCQTNPGPCRGKTNTSVVMCESFRPFSAKREADYNNSIHNGQWMTPEWPPFHGLAGQMALPMLTPMSHLMFGHATLSRMSLTPLPYDNWPSYFPLTSGTVQTASPSGLGHFDGSMLSPQHTSTRGFNFSPQMPVSSRPFPQRSATQIMGPQMSAAQLPFRPASAPQSPQPSRIAMQHTETTEESRRETERQARRARRHRVASAPIRVDGFPEGNVRLPPYVWENGQEQLVREYPNHLYGKYLYALVEQFGWTSKMLADMAGGGGKITRNAMGKRVQKVLGNWKKSGRKDTIASQRP